MIPKIDNISGIVKVKFIYFENMVSFSYSVDGFCSLILKHGTNFEEVYGSFESIALEAVVKKNNAGDYFDISLKLTHPNDDLINQVQIKELCRHKIIVAIVYQNGLQKVFGHEHPAFCVYDFNAKLLESSRNLLCTCQTTEEPKYFDYSIAIPIG